MSKSVPVLGYWDLRGLANPIRYLLHHVDAEYQDKFYTAGPPPNFERPEWLADKFSLGLDFPNLPYYLDGDVKLSQSSVILRYLAKKYNLVGKTEQDTLRVELAAAQVTDYHMDFVRIVYNPQFLQLKEEYSKNVPAKLDALTKFLGEREYVAGDYVTYADFLLFEYLEGQLFFNADLLKEHPVLAAYHKRAQTIPGVQKYFSKPGAVKFPFNGAPAFFGGKYSDELVKTLQK